MSNNEIRNLTTEEIITKIKESKEELFNLRFQQATGNLEKPSRIRELRHQVARLKTVLNEREMRMVLLLLKSVLLIALLLGGPVSLTTIVFLQMVLST